MTYCNILVAVDTTDEADQVLSAAKEMMASKTTTISIIHVMKPITNFYVDLYLAIGDPTEFQLQAVERATDWLNELANRHGISADRVEVIIGTPATEIRRLAEKTGVDLIVMGTHGQHGLGLMLGSTANAVLHGVPCNVLTVRVQDA
jgi:universal stress protein A